MSRFLYEWKKDLFARMPVVLWVILTLVATLSGPFGSLEIMGFWRRLVFWAIVVGLSVIAGTAARTLVFQVMGVKSILGAAPIIAAIVTLACTGPFWVLTFWMSGPDGAPRVSPLELAVTIALFSCCISAFRMALQVSGIIGGRQLAPGQPDMISPPAPEAPALLDRLPDEMRGDLLSISARNHYVDVVTSEGRASLLMRLADAVLEAAPIDGAQIHRSHWVAWAAVVSAERQGARLWVSLVNGDRIPASRSQRPLLEARGLLPAPDQAGQPPLPG